MFEPIHGSVLIYKGNCNPWILLVCSDDVRKFSELKAAQKLMLLLKVNQTKYLPKDLGGKALQNKLLKQ